MEFLQSLTYEDIRDICFEDNLLVLCEHENLGSYQASIKEDVKSENVFHVSLHLKVQTEEGYSETRITATLENNLSTVNQEKYEHLKVGRKESEMITHVYKEIGATYYAYSTTISTGIHEGHKTKQESKANKRVPETKFWTFLSEAATIALLRIIAKKKPEEAMKFHCLDSELDICTFTCIPHGITVRYLQGLDYKVVRVQGVMKTKDKETVSWESYYNKNGYLMFYNQDGSPVYFLFPKPSAKVDSPFAVNLRRKQGIRYMYAIGEKTVEDIIFSESNKVYYGNNEGNITVSVEKSYFKAKPCIFIHIDTLVQTTDGFISVNIASYVNMHLETLEYQKHKCTQKRGFREQTIVLISDNELGQVKVERTHIVNKNVVHSVNYFTDEDFYGFLSRASSILIQRVLIKNGLTEHIHFTTLSEDGQLCTLIFRPIEEETYGFGNEKEVFGIECSVVPELGTVTVWQNYFNSEGYLLSGFYPGSPLRIEYCRKSDAFQKRQIHSPDIFSYPHIFQDGNDFIQSIGQGDLQLVLFSDKLEIKVGDEDIGEVSVHIDDHIKKEGYIIVHISSSMQVKNGKSITNILGKLSPSLSPIHQVLQEYVEIGGECVFLRETTIRSVENGYKLNRTIGNLFKREKFLQTSEDEPFICETSALLLERLIVRKKVTESLEFSSINPNLTKCKVRYHVTGKDWECLSGKRYEVICMQRSVAMADRSTSLHWKMSFSKTGKCVKRKQKGVLAEMCVKASVVEDRDFYLLLPPEVVKHDPALSLPINLHEVHQLLFGDNSCVVFETSTGMSEIGSYSVTVDHVDYQGHDAFLVQISQVTSIEGYTCGSNITGYISFNLEILHFKKLEYVKTSYRKYETFLTFAKEFDAYHFQYTETCDNVASSTSKWWCLPRKRLYICEASAVLIQRLMIFREMNDPLNFISFDDAGDVCTVEFVPKSTTFLTVGREIYDVVGIDYIIRYKNKKINVKKIFSKTGYAISHVQEGSRVQLKHLFIQRPEKFRERTRCPTYEKCQLTSTDENSLEQKKCIPTLPSVDLDCLEQLLGTHEFTAVKNDKEVGILKLCVKNVHCEETHYILVHLEANLNDSETEVRSTSTDLLSLEFELLHHLHIYSLKKEDLCIKKTLSMKRQNMGFYIKHTIAANEVTEVHPETLYLKETNPLISEASCLLFQIVLAKKNATGIFKFAYVDANKTVCDVIVNSFGTQKATLYGIDADFYGIYTEVTPWKKCSLLWRAYFDKNGSLLFYNCIGHRLFIKTTHLFEKLNIIKNMLLETTCKIINNLGPSDFEDIIFPDYAHIVLNGSVVGTYSVVIDTVHFEGKHFFSICMSTSVCMGKVKCTTTMHALVTSDLKTHKYVFHEQSDHFKHPWDAKAIVILKDGVYNVEVIRTRDNETKRYFIPTPSQDVTPLCSEAVGILVMRLMAKRKHKGEMEFKCIDRLGDICVTKYQPIGLCYVKVSGIRIRAWKIRTLTTFEDGEVMVWEHNLTLKGQLLSRRQVDVPFLVTVPTTLCRNYRGQCEESVKHTPTQVLKMKQVKHVDEYQGAKTAAEDFCHYILTNKTTDILTVAENFFLAYTFGAGSQK